MLQEVEVEITVVQKILNHYKNKLTGLSLRRCLLFQELFAVLHGLHQMNYQEEQRIVVHNLFPEHNWTTLYVWGGRSFFYFEKRLNLLSDWKK